MSLHTFFNRSNLVNNNNIDQINSSDSDKVCVERIRIVDIEIFYFNETSITPLTQLSLLCRKVN